MNFQFYKMVPRKYTTVVYIIGWRKIEVLNRTALFMIQLLPGLVLSCGCYSHKKARFIHTHWMQPCRKIFHQWHAEVQLLLCDCFLHAGTFSQSVTSLSAVDYVMPWFWSGFQFMLINFNFLSHFSSSVSKNPQLKMCVF